MFINSWIERVGQSLKRGSRRKNGRREDAGRAAERLEERCLLSCDALFVSGELDIALGSTDSVAVEENPTAPGTVLIVVNGLPLANFPTVAASSVTKVLITGGDDANLIDLTGMTSAVFNNPALSIEVHGGNGPDTLLGSDSLNDSLDGGHGTDSIVGNGGNDTLLGDDGNDTISGGNGDDSIDGGDGQDTVDGGNGNDTILGGDGQDSITGSAGNDSIDGGNGEDTLLGGDDGDFMNGGAGRDSIDGQNGDDTLFGGANNDTLLGGSGADSVDGQGGNDLEFAEAVAGQAPVSTTLTSSTVFSTDFNNGVPAQLSGTTTVAAVQGYAGIGTGTNLFSGNLLQNATGGTNPAPGTVAQTATTLTLTNLPTHTSIDIDFLLAILNSWDGLVAVAPPTVAPDFFNVRVDGTLLFHGSFDNVRQGTAQGYIAPAGVQLTPYPLVDLGFPSLAPANAVDSAWNIGLDPLFNSIPHTASTLTIDFFADGAGFQGAQNESWGIDNLDVVLNGVPVTTTILSNDTLLGSAGNDTINGADGNDLLNGQAGDDLVIGNNGDDCVLGGNGNDALFGDDNDPNTFGTGNDSVFGNAGSDTLDGGGGADSLDGGAGNDLVKSGDFDSINGIILTITDAPNVVEGNAGQTTNAVFTVLLNRASAQTITVQYATADGSATAGSDYTAVSGTLTFAPGVTSQTILVPVIGDGVLEADENFFVRLSNSTNAFIGDTEGETFILNDDAWQTAGPAPVNNAQVQNIAPNDPIVGAIEALAVHPTNPNIMYVGGVQGGIWRTDNATAASPTWTPQTDFLQSLSIGSIEFDPTDATGNTLVASFADSSSFQATGGRELGMLRTTDGGATWTSISSPLLQGQTILNVSARGNVLMAASDNIWSGNGGNGLFRSTDGGATFVQVSNAPGAGLPNGSVSSLVGDPNNLSRFYVGVRGRGVFRSDDGGATWVNASNGLTGISGFNNGRILFAVHSTATTNAVYAAVVGNNGQYSGLFRSANAGANWTAMDTPNVLGGQGAVHGAITADSVNPNLVYVSGDAGRNTLLDAVRGDASAPSGAQLTSIVGANVSNTTPHADSRRLRIAADGTLINTSDGGVYRLSSPQQNGGAWTSVNGNLQILEEHDMAYDPVSNIIFAGVQDNGTDQQTATGSLTWTQTFGGDGGDVVVDPLAIANQSIRYSSAQNLQGFHGEIYSAANALVNQFIPTLTVAGNGAALIPGFVTPLATDSVAGNRLLIAGSNSLYESLNRGTTITEVGVGLVANGGNAIAYGGQTGGVANPNLIDVGAGNRILQRVAAGNNFVALASYPGTFVEAIVLDPNNSNNIYVADSASQVWQSTDGGVTWTGIRGNLAGSNLRSIEFVTGANPAIVVGAQEGVFHMLISTPNVWGEMGASSLPNSQVTETHYNAANDLLVVGTMGRGSWILNNASLVQQLNSPVSSNGGIVTFTGVGDTLLGGDGNDTILGADGNDVLNGGTGDDSLAGGLGNDSLLGGSGNDTLDGGPGDDTLAGQGGKDSLIGGDGNDTFQWSVGDGDDFVSSVGGFDQMQVFGTSGADIVSVSKVGPRLKVTSGTNDLLINSDIHVVSIDTGAGDDIVTVGDLTGVSQTVLTISGGDGNDRLDASGALLGDVRLQLNGNDGNDTLIGSASDDTIDGGTGKDSILGGAGNDQITGGADNDAINGQAGDDSITGDDGNDTLAGGDGNDLVNGGNGNDAINGNDGADTLTGAAGRDTLQGGTGNDSLDSGNGRDYLSGGDGDDTLDGGFNDDTIFGDGGADTIRGNHGNDSIDGGTGDDTISGGDGNDTITGSDGNDLITGADGNDVINGAAGNDTLTGGDGNDLIAGGAGSDVILGDDGQDTLKGNGGTNTLAGGQGVDTIISLPTDVIIENFTISDDLLKKLDLM